MQSVLPAKKTVGLTNEGVGKGDFQPHTVSNVETGVGVHHGLDDRLDVSRHGQGIRRKAKSVRLGQ